MTSNWFLFLSREPCMARKPSESEITDRQRVKRKYLIDACLGHWVSMRAHRTHTPFYEWREMNNTNDWLNNGMYIYIFTDHSSNHFTVATAASSWPFHFGESVKMISIVLREIIIMPRCDSIASKQSFSLFLMRVERPSSHLRFNYTFAIGRIADVLCSFARSGGTQWRQYNARI